MKWGNKYFSYHSLIILSAILCIGSENVFKNDIMNSKRREIKECLDDYKCDTDSSDSDVFSGKNGTKKNMKYSDSNFIKSKEKNCNFRKSRNSFKITKTMSLYCRNLDIIIKMMKEMRIETGNNQSNKEELKDDSIIANYKCCVKGILKSQYSFLNLKHKNLCATCKNKNRKIISNKGRPIKGPEDNQFCEKTQRKHKMTRFINHILTKGDHKPEQNRNKNVDYKYRDRNNIRNKYYEVISTKNNSTNKFYPKISKNSSRYETGIRVTTEYKNFNGHYRLYNQLKKIKTLLWDKKTEIKEPNKIFSKITKKKILIKTIKQQKNNIIFIITLMERKNVIEIEDLNSKNIRINFMNIIKKWV